MAPSARSAVADLPRTIVRACREGGLLEPGDRVVVAVSAGADSTALAVLLAEAGPLGLPLDLVLGHVDHGWRGAAEAAADRAVLESLARRLGLPLFCSPPAPADTPRTEDGARRWRYRWLGRLAAERGAARVASGHHAGDQAETFLMRLLRGSGLAGLTGIPARRALGPGSVQVVRPLLEIEPAALRTFLRARSVAWREDRTNRDLSRDRARIRARLRELSERAPDPVPTLAALAQRLARRLRAREQRLEALAGHHFRHHRAAGAVEMPRALLAPWRGEDLALLLRRAGRALHADASGPWFTRRHVACFADLLEAEGDLDLPRGLRLHVRGGRAWLARRTPPAHIGLGLERDDMRGAAFDLAAFLARGREDEAALDADVLGPHARLRRLAPDDGFQPHGRGGERTVRIAAWLARRGYPELARRGALVVEGAAGVAWVVGHRVDRRHVVGPRTRTVAHLTVRAATL